jgi:hypothetical protein
MIKTISIDTVISQPESGCYLLSPKDGPIKLKLAAGLANHDDKEYLFFADTTVTADNFVTIEAPKGEKLANGPFKLTKAGQVLVVRRLAGKFWRVNG